MRVLEAGGRAGRGHAAAREVLKSFARLADDLDGQVLERLTRLRDALLAKITGTLDLTSFQRSTLLHLAADVDRLVAQAGGDLALEAERAYRSAVDLGTRSVDASLHAAQLDVHPAFGGLDHTLVSAAFDNTVDLLSLPMTQFASSIKVAVRGVTLAGENRFEALAKLRDLIESQGFGQAQYRSERIIRTEVSRVFNSATNARMADTAADFPFLLKAWQATNDDRTRLGHREASADYAPGKGIPVADPFEVRVYQESKKGTKLKGTVRLLFPSDPNASPSGALAAAATIFCRCNSLVDYKVADLEKMARSRVALSLSA